jgi:hypothetical protein
MANDANLLLGGNGSVDLNAASGATTFPLAANGPIPRVISALNGAAVAFSAITDATNTGDLLTSLGAGSSAYGRFTQLTVSSGVVRCYY